MNYDYLVAGGGAAGLSFVYHLLEAGGTATVLLLDRERKTRNDRTWSFWEAGAGPFEDRLYARWDHLWFHSDTFSKRLTIAPYAYKTLRGIDFYDAVNARIDAAPNVTRVFGEVEDLRSTADGVLARVGDTTYAARYAFSSIPPAPLDRDRANYLDQHFKGWIIETDTDAFDVDTATLMDFRLPQCGETRFVYVLPFGPRRAMLEFTVFGKTLLAPAAYDAHLRDYIARFVTRDSYRVESEELGVIPMTDQPLPRENGRIYYLGTAGGSVKASTGYAFQRIQATTKTLAAHLVRTGSPVGVRWPGSARYRLFDSTLLNVLVHHRLSADYVFTELFRNNPPARLLRFLGEESSPLEDLRIMASVPTGPFLRAFVAEAVG